MRRLRRLWGRRKGGEKEQLSLERSRRVRLWRERGGVGQWGAGSMRFGSASAAMISRLSIFLFVGNGGRRMELEWFRKRPRHFCE